MGRKNDMVRCAVHYLQHDLTHLRGVEHHGVLGERHIADLGFLLGVESVQCVLHPTEIAEFFGYFCCRTADNHRLRRVFRHNSQL